MIQSVKAPVSVTLIYDHRRRLAYPSQVTWEGRDYRIEKVGYHHTYRQGRTLIHVYSVAARTMFFRLVLNSENLMWEVEQISDNEVG